LVDVADRLDLDVLLQTERLLLDVRDRSGAGVEDGDLWPQRDEPEPEIERVVQRVTRGIR